MEIYSYVQGVVKTAYTTTTAWATCSFEGGFGPKVTTKKAVGENGFSDAPCI